MASKTPSTDAAMIARAVLKAICVSPSGTGTRLKVSATRSRKFSGTIWSRIGGPYPCAISVALERGVAARHAFLEVRRQAVAGDRIDGVAHVVVVAVVVHVGL